MFKTRFGELTPTSRLRDIERRRNAALLRPHVVPEACDALGRNAAVRIMALRPDQRESMGLEDELGGARAAGYVEHHRRPEPRNVWRLGHQLATVSGARGQARGLLAYACLAPYVLLTRAVPHAIAYSFSVGVRTGGAYSPVDHIDNAALAKRSISSHLSVGGKGLRIGGRVIPQGTVSMFRSGNAWFYGVRHGSEDDGPRMIALAHAYLAIQRDHEFFDVVRRWQELENHARGQSA